MRRLRILATSIVFVLSATALAAHDEYRIIGKVTKRQDALIEVKTKEGKTWTINMNDRTLVKRDKTKISASELKRGLSVVVDARGDSEQDLMADEVRIVPALAAPAAKQR